MMRIELTLTICIILNYASAIIIDDLSTLNDPCGSSSDCGLRPANESVANKIVGGIAVKDPWPWMAALYLKPTDPTASAQFLCGAAILSQNHVITAAHCVIYSASRYEIHAGMINLTNQTPRKFGVQRISKPNGYDSRQIYLDIAVLRLTVRFSYGQNTAAVCLPVGDYMTNNFEGWNATVLGWGSLKFAGSRVDQLQQVTIPIIKSDICEADYRKYFNTAQDFGLNFPKGFPQNALCAGLAEGGKDSCQGDSGGPMTVQLKNGRHVLIGIVSFGLFCGRPNIPGIYTRVSDYIPWILNRTSTP